MADTIETVKKKKCFIITPIGDIDSTTRRQADGVIDEVICPVLKEPEFDFDIRIPHRIYDPGSITKQVISDIYDSDLVVANLTGLNPNVMYELSFRHACGKPVIHICENGTKLPFDIKDQRTIFYDNDMAGAFQLKTEFRNMLLKVIDITEDKNNPIYNGLTMHSIYEVIHKPETTGFEKNVLTILSDLTQRIDSVANNYRNNLNIIRPSAKNIRVNISVAFNLNDNLDMSLDDLLKSIKSWANKNRFKLNSLFLDPAFPNEHIVCIWFDTNRFTDEQIFLNFVVSELTGLFLNYNLKDVDVRIDDMVMS